MKVLNLGLAPPGELPFFFAGDIHIGNVSWHKYGFVRDMDRAKAENRRVILTGDVFDAIFPDNDPRHKPSLLVPELRGRDDAPDYAVEMAVDLMDPYAENLDVIMLGNHEDSVYKYHGTNMAARLVRGLNQRMRERAKKSKVPHKIRYGSVCAYIAYTLKTQSSHTSTKRLVIWAHHGMGGDSPVTKGMINVNRILVNWDFDIMIFGHKHHTFAVRDVRMMPVFPRSRLNGVLETKNIIAIQIGSYYENYRTETAMDTSRAPFTEMASHAPKPLGGVFASVAIRRDRHLDDEGREKDVEKFLIKAEI